MLLVLACIGYWSESRSALLLRLLAATPTLCRLEFLAKLEFLASWEGVLSNELFDCWKDSLGWEG
jgi:hypothetical protein